MSKRILSYVLGKKDPPKKKGSKKHFAYRYGPWYGHGGYGHGLGYGHGYGYGPFGFPSIPWGYHGPHGVFGRYGLSDFGKSVQNWTSSRFLCFPF